MKLHLGCGKRYIADFIHIDAIGHAHVDHISQVDALPFLADNSVELIYNCHVLEHFMRRDTGRVLREWFRVLKPGGVLRTSVPDFMALARVYLEKDFPLESIIGPLYGRCDYLYNVHYNVFDAVTLSTQLELAGFHKITRYDWRETEHADVDDFSQAYLPHMQKDTGTLISLNMEATKPVDWSSNK